MDAIYDKYYYKIYNWALSKTNNREDAEDLTNNVFVAIFEYFGKNIKIEKIDNLIWKIAHNMWCVKAKDYIKEKSNVSIEDGSSISYEVSMLDKIIYTEIINNLGDIGLTIKEKRAFEMYYINNLSIKEISDKMSTKEQNIKYYLYSARNRIKEKYHE